MRSEWVAARAFLSNLQRQTIAQANMHRQGHSFHVCDWASVKMTTQQRTQLAAAGVLGLKCAGQYQITRQVSHNTFELTLPPGARIHSLFTTPRLVPSYMAPQGVSDVIVPLEALSQEVLDGFNQLFLDVGQPPLAFDNYEGAPLRCWPMTVYPLSKLFQLMPLRQLLILTPTEYWY